MALARKKIGVVVVDMEAKNPSFRTGCFTRPQRLADVPMYLDGIPRSADRQGIVDFCSGPGTGQMWVGEGRGAVLLEKPENGKIVWVHQPSMAQDRVYRNVARLLSAANGMGLPVALVEFNPEIAASGSAICAGKHSTHRSLIEAAGPDAGGLVKNDFSCFSAKGFAEFLEGLEAVVIGGYKDSLCVLKTVQDILALANDPSTPYPLQVMTSGQILLAGKNESRSGRKETVDFYREKTDFYKTVDRLISAIRKKASLD